jgi:hypothetical protein
MSERIPDVSAFVPERATDDWTHERGAVSVRRVRYRGLRAAVLKVFGIPPTFTIHLDTLGTEVWLLIDGRRTVAEIRDELAKREPQATDLGPRLGKFLGAMVSRKFVVLRPPRHP